MPRSSFPAIACSTHPLFLLALAWNLVAPGCGTAGISLDGGVADGRPPFGDASLCVRRILEGQVTNARDLGGHPLGADKSTACRSLFRGGDLSGLDAAGCAELDRLGIKSVVDLREPEAQQSQPPPSCVTARATHVLAPMPKLLPDTTVNYLALLEEKAAVAKIFSALGATGSYPAYMHCIIGRDRASFASALVLLAVGASRQTVIDEFKLSAEARVPVKPECIEALLDEIESRGGIEAYLASAGVGAAELGVLRERMSP